MADQMPGQGTGQVTSYASGRAEPVAGRGWGAAGPAGFITGVGFLMRGIGMYARSPRLMLLGLIPALITTILLIGAFVGMVYTVDDVARWLTPWADGWSAGPRDVLRLVIMVSIVAVWLVVSVVAFTALTLVVGQPFYEAISKQVDDQLGGIENEIDVSFWRTLPRTIVESVRLLVLALGVAVLAFTVGLIPAAGQILGPTLGATLGGWILAVELTSVPFERRGLRLRQRRAALRRRRGMSLGFGVATFVCFLIPLGAVVLMPAAVAGATLLSRRVLDGVDGAAG